MEPLTEVEVRAFVGLNADYYVNRWCRFDDETKEAAPAGMGFNWAAFLICGLWMPYRKMYMLTLIFFAIILAESMAEDVIFEFVLRQESPPSFNSLVSLIVAAICGAFGNRWYFNHACKVIGQVRELGLVEESHLRELARRGGTNLLAACGFLGLLFATIVAYAIVLEMVRPGN